MGERIIFITNETNAAADVRLIQGYPLVLPPGGYIRVPISNGVHSIVLMPHKPEKDQQELKNTYLQKE